MFLDEKRKTRKALLTYCKQVCNHSTYGFKLQVE